MQNASQTKPFRIVVLGEGGVGKSALVVRYIAGRFLYQYNPTLEDEYKKQILLDGDLLDLRIFDTAGQGERQQEQYFAIADAVLIAFSLTDGCSLERARALGRQLQGGEKKIPAVLVGTKQDRAEERSVSYDNASALAGELKCCYVESSAAYDTGVTEAFNLAAKLALDVRVSTPGPIACNSKLRRSGSIRKSVRRIGSLLRKATGA